MEKATKDFFAFMGYLGDDLYIFGRSFNNSISFARTCKNISKWLCLMKNNPNKKAKTSAIRLMKTRVQKCRWNIKKLNKKFTKLLKNLNSMIFELKL